MTLAPSPETTNLNSEASFEPFLLNPRNRDFFLGKMPYVASYKRGWRIALTVGVFLVGVVGFVLACGLIYEYLGLTQRGQRKAQAIN